MRRLLLGWDRFWFAPTSPSPVCLLRMFFGVLAFGQAVLMLPDVLTWYGHDGVLSIESARRLQNGPRLSLLLWLDPSNKVVTELLWLQMLASVAVLVGFLTRWSTLLVWLLVQAFALRNPLMHYEMDSFLRVFGFLLIFAPAGAMWSVDAYLKKRKQPLCAPWAQRLMQIQVTLFYWQSFWGKVPGKTWWDGTALYYITHTPDLVHHQIPSMLDRMWFYHTLTVLSLVTELLMWSLVWVKKTRYVVLLMGVMFHVIMQWLFNLDLSEFATLAGYIAFVDPVDIDRVIRAVKRPLEKAVSFVGGSRWTR